MADDLKVQCPSCNSRATYKYGKVKTGKQRFYCLLCGRQFTLRPKRTKIKNRPVCSKCGKAMHLYKREDKVIRFRCSGYPRCKTFSKVKAKK